jgi:putative endonuclease
MSSPAHPWYVYLLSCSDDTLYCGITNDLQRRLDQHNRGRAGAKYTRARRPVNLVYAREFPDRASAARFEYRLKQLDRAQKLRLLTEYPYTAANGFQTKPPLHQQ